MTLPNWLFPKSLLSEKKGHYTELSATAILKTIATLEVRICERFPESGLRQVCKEFHQLAIQTESLAVRLGKPILPVRFAAILAIVLLFTGIGSLTWSFIQKISFNVSNVTEFVQATEAVTNEIILLSIALFFLLSLETRLKRQVALQSLHRLRSIAHVVDMHQLTKDPPSVLTKMPPNLRDTDGSPARTLTRYELARYLDYCSELLALNSKVAALFAQTMDDPIILSAVNDVESLTQGLSSKIWQKIMILDLAEENN